MAYSTFAPRLLDQAEIWVDANRTVHRLDEMDPHHRANLIPFLRSWARELLPNHPDPQVGLAETPLMRRLMELEEARPIEDRKATQARNRRHEEATGYQKSRPRKED